MDIDELIEEALRAQSEAAHIEFKEQFDVKSKEDWCKIICHIIAISNTDGGVILFGVCDDGKLSGFDVADILALDPAIITDKIKKYTQTNFSGFELFELEKEETLIAALVIYQSPIPTVFQKPGTYNVGDGKQDRAFSEGTIYFRHGAKYSVI